MFLVRLVPTHTEPLAHRPSRHREAPLQECPSKASKVRGCNPGIRHAVPLNLQGWQPVLLQARGDVVDAHATIPLPQAPWQPTRNDGRS